MDPLADFADVQAGSPVDLTGQKPYIEELLKRASAIVRNYTRQQFTRSETTERIRPVGTKLRLPQRPVVSVSAVLAFYNGTGIPLVGWVWDGAQEIWLVQGENTVINLAEGIRDLFRYDTPMVDVTYTHGYATVPEDVKAIVCDLVTRTVATPAFGAVKTQIAGPMSVTYAEGATGGVSTLTDDQRAVLNTYRRSARSVELR